MSLVGSIMKNKILLLRSLTLIPIVGLFLTQPANAEWEYTEWGMSMKEVLEASDGTAVPLEEPIINGEQKTLLKSDWEFNQYQFEVLLNFVGSEPQLSEVVLISQGDTTGLVGALNQRFGRPIRMTGKLQRSEQPRSFTLIEEETFARPETSSSNLSSSDDESLLVLVEWETETNFIQLIRQSPTDVTIRLKPVPE